MSYSQTPESYLPIRSLLSCRGIYYYRAAEKMVEREFARISAKTGATKQPYATPNAHGNKIYYAARRKAFKNARGQINKMWMRGYRCGNLLMSHWCLPWEDLKEDAGSGGTF